MPIGVPLSEPSPQTVSTAMAALLGQLGGRARSAAWPAATSCCQSPFCGEPWETDDLARAGRAAAARRARGRPPASPCDSAGSARCRRAAPRRARRSRRRCARCRGRTRPARARWRRARAAPPPRPGSPAVSSSSAATTRLVMARRRRVSGRSRRSRVGRRGRRAVGQPEAVAVDGLDQRGVAELAPQRRQVHVEHLGRPVPVLVPGPLDDLLPADQPAGVGGQALQDRELLGRQRDLGARHRHLPGAQVDGERPVPQHLGRAAAPGRWPRRSTARIRASSSARPNGLTR